MIEVALGLVVGSQLINLIGDKMCNGGWFHYHYFTLRDRPPVGGSNGCRPAPLGSRYEVVYLSLGRQAS